MKISIIDNGSQWTHRIWRVLRELDVDAQIVKEPTKDISGLILSGGPMRMSTEDINNNYFNLSIPILGLCVGHQYMAKAFGGKVEPSKQPEYGKVELTLVGEDKLFEGIPKTSIVWTSHNDEVTQLPEEFVCLAKSNNCKIQAMKHKSKPFYGLQFHPEVEHTEYGEQIFKNFITICNDY
jgi:GMP synthase (glutamine-hydrolysing)